MERMVKVWSSSNILFDIRALDFNVGVAVGLRNIRRKTTVVGEGQWSLKEGSRDVIATEMKLLLVATLDSSGQNSIAGEVE